MTKTRIGLISLGCPKNLVDAEEMLGALAETGQAEMVGDARAAEVLVVNTCAFIVLTRFLTRYGVKSVERSKRLS
jgi:ribosomal protein S12 methylthiotransferase